MDSALVKHQKIPSMSLSTFHMYITHSNSGTVSPNINATLHYLIAYKVLINIVLPYSHSKSLDDDDPHMHQCS